ncbi:alkaline phosphatase family protein [Tepidiforma bonchosmolovskayae]|uniref:Sulfatase-like hydrolase/transferase n=1 Tax=Tepidiforma bonchosmolovskayae TaxID=2601677 RepID=A0ABX6C4Y3_9CHLR|nr:alkaline phosphatase family protein [Tepidiforma bonchosmolovskayae]QFG03753.1 sulfatase-like hydrolase/transferase [Tepidiforma bonchosmolovskayae]
MQTTMTAAAVGPERPGGQGLDPHQEESGSLAIHKLLTTEDGRAWTDFVATARQERDGSWSYEAWALRGMVRWIRRYAPEGGYVYEVVEVVGENPLERQDYRALATYDEEMAAAGNPADVQQAYIEPERLTYPYAYERISQLFDSPNGPDLIVNPKSYAYGRQPGQHGALDVVQSRSPLVISGPGVKRGAVVDAPAKQVDIAPTIARLMGFPLIDGRDITGRTSSERGCPPDVYLERQDGRVLEEVLDEATGRPERVYILLLDGQSHTELLYRLEREPEAIPNLRRLIVRGCLLQYGSITNFPSITWPSHNAIGTGTWSGHHDVVNPTYYLRATRELVSPQGMQFETARFLNPEVETLFEAFKRVLGDGAFTASINEPCTRGADHASLERRLVGDRGRLIALTKETEHEINPRWYEELEEEGHRLQGQIDNRALAQARLLFLDESHPAPVFVYHEFAQPDSSAHDYGPHHEGARAALDETDRRIGHILRTLEERGLFETTLFVITTDHGMATQNVELRANPARIPQRDGMAAITAEPCIYLRDLRVEVEVTHDGRSARFAVADNDADAHGEHPPVAGAEIVVTDRKDGLVARVVTDANGLAACAVPAELEPGELLAAVHAEGFNPRHLRLDGTSVCIDLREVLYGQG